MEDWPTRSEFMVKYNIYEKEGAVFRGRAGSGFVTEIRGSEGWEPYTGDPLAPVAFGDFLGTEKSEPADTSKQ